MAPAYYALYGSMLRYCIGLKLEKHGLRVLPYVPTKIECILGEACKKFEREWRDQFPDYNMKGVEITRENGGEKILRVFTEIFADKEFSFWRMVAFFVCLQIIAEYLYENKCNDYMTWMEEWLVYLDYAKTSDSVRHSRLKMTRILFGIC